MNHEYRTLKGYKLRDHREITDAMEDYLEMICRSAQQEGYARQRGEYERIGRKAPERGLEVEGVAVEERETDNGQYVEFAHHQRHQYGDGGEIGARYQGTGYGHAHYYVVGAEDALNDDALFALVFSVEQGRRYAQQVYDQYAAKREQYQVGPYRRFQFSVIYVGEHHEGQKYLKRYFVHLKDIANVHQIQVPRCKTQGKYKKYGQHGVEAKQYVFHFTPTQPEKEFVHF